MSSREHSLLELQLRGLFSTHAEVFRDGQPLTTTTTLHSPLNTAFVIEGHHWQTGIHVPGGRGIDVLREVVLGGVLVRGCFALKDGSASAVASAREGGLFTGGYALSLGGEPARLKTDRKRSRFDYHGPGGSGVCQHLAAQRLVRAKLPATLPAAQQLFIVLLALRCWVNFSSRG